MNPAELELLTVAELAQLAKQSEKTIRRAIADGRIRIVRPFGGRAVRVPLGEARRYLEGRADPADTISPLHSLPGG